LNPELESDEIELRAKHSAEAPVDRMEVNDPKAQLRPDERESHTMQA
jgi:hypothetical protein